jgi:hypothetical protein
MNTAVEDKKPKQYNPNMTIRVPRPVREALLAMAKNNNERLTDLVLRDLQPFALYASKEGQEAFERIRQAIVESSTVHKGLPEGGHEAWLWHGLDVRNYGTNEEPFLVHTVKHYEGATREDAIRDYTEKVWKEWCLVEEHERTKVLEEVTDPTKHLFLVGFVNFKTWKKFPSVYEASLHRSFFVEGKGRNIYKSSSVLAEPQGAEELMWLAQAHKYLQELVEREDRTLVGAQSGLPLYELLVLPYYEHVSKEENIEAMARQLLKYHQQGEYELGEVPVRLDVLTVGDSL